MKRRQPRDRSASGRLFTLAALVVIGLLWVRLLFTQPRAEEPPTPVDPQQARQAQRKLAEISGAVKGLEEASRRGETQKTVVRLSAADINALLTAEPEVRGVLEQARVRNPRVRIRDGRLITTGTLEAAGVPVTVRAEGRLTAYMGMLMYDSDRVRVRGVPAPAALRNAVDGRIQEAFRQLERKVQARVDRVTITGDRITLHLSSEPM